MQPPSIVIVFVVVIALLLVLSSILVRSLTVGQPTLIEKPYEITDEEEKRFRMQYDELLKKYWKQYPVEWAYSSPSTYDMMQRPVDVNNLVERHCCAPVTYDEQGNLDVATKSAFLSCVPCHRIRPWCPTAKSQQTCDSVYCKWQDNMCKAYDRPMSIATPFCQPNQTVACYDYGSFPMVSPSSK